MKNLVVHEMCISFSLTNRFTLCRQKCVGLVSLCYRVACIINAVVTPDGGIPLPAMICYSSGPIIGAALCLLLPETSGIPLPDTVQDCQKQPRLKLSCCAQWDKTKLIQDLLDYFWIIYSGLIKNIVFVFISVGLNRTRMLLLPRIMAWRTKWNPVLSQHNQQEEHSENWLLHIIFLFVFVFSMKIKYKLGSMLGISTFQKYISRSNTFVCVCN